MQPFIVPSRYHGNITFSSSSRLYQWLLFLFLAGLAITRAQGQDLTGDSLYITGYDGVSTIYGGLGVDTLNVTDGETLLGGLSVDTLNYGDYPALGSLSAVGFGSTDEITASGNGIGGTYWTWETINMYGTETQMTLDINDILTLYNDSGNLVLDPGNQTLAFNDGSLFKEGSGNFTLNSGGCITFDPSSQAIVFSGGLVISGDAGNLTIVTASGGYALGGLTTATGNQSAALGGNAAATGLYAVALANGTASGVGALSAGEGNASGNWSVALIGGTANATDGFALGSGAYVNATGAMALGNGTTAEAWSAMTVGHYNANITGNTTGWSTNDPAFIVGVGNSSTKANGLTVFNNGGVSVGTYANSTVAPSNGLLAEVWQLARPALDGPLSFLLTVVAKRCRDCPTMAAPMRFSAMAPTSTVFAFSAPARVFSSCTRHHTAMGPTYE